MSLKSSIRQAEHSIVERRGRIKGALDGVTYSVSKRLVSPGALVAAGLFGAALYRYQRSHDLKILPMLAAADTGLRELLRLYSRTH